MITLLRVVKAALRLGFTLEEVSELLETGRGSHIIASFDFKVVAVLQCGQPYHDPYARPVIKTFVFDVGETIVCDDRYWAAWAEWLDVPRHTLSALVGAVVARGHDNADAVRLLRPDIDMDAESAAREATGRGEYLDETDLYPDVRPALTMLRDAGHRIVIAGNQTSRAADLLRALDLPADAIATSGEWGVAKPAPTFFAHVIELADAEPRQVVYVGDNPADDVVPAKAAGLLVAHIRRGPWGHLWADHPIAARADWRITTLMELTTIATR
ncbi:HAD-IA family hydrolase [Nonomuraea sp. NPDC049158]|uniref:HAD-IA family hydrolase n=1 Tax=Nonomuraea sp. NPDC049158 TaxID=3155649 RepID=UPI0033BFE308